MDDHEDDDTDGVDDDDGDDEHDNDDRFLTQTFISCSTVARCPQAASTRISDRLALPQPFETLDAMHC